jgi:hypothetical protein
MTNLSQLSAPFRQEIPLCPARALSKNYDIRSINHHSDPAPILPARSTGQHRSKPSAHTPRATSEAAFTPGVLPANPQHAGPQHQMQNA